MYVKHLRKRGANVVVEAHAEVLGTPGSELSRWEARLRSRIRTAVVREAPTNERPRWGHYGKPLKSTITSKGKTHMRPGGPVFYSAIGSTAPHAYYVDQGTGVFNGGGPYAAKILPPWARGEASLYEATWHPPNQQANHVVMIKGQRGQHFMADGLDDGFRSMGLRKYLGLKAGAASAAFPNGLADFVGNTPNTEAFRASLDDWRRWRDRRFNSGGVLGRDGGGKTAEAGRRSERAAALSAKRAAQRAAAAGPSAAERAIAAQNRARKEAYAASKAAAERRKKAALAAAKKQADAKALGEKRRREKEQREAEAQKKATATRAFAKAQRDARAYADVLRKAYPNVEVLISAKNKMARVRWTDSEGTVHRTDFS